MIYREIRNNGDGSFTLIEGERSMTITAEVDSPELLAACEAFFTTAD